MYNTDSQRNEHMPGHVLNGIDNSLVGNVGNVNSGVIGLNKNHDAGSGSLISFEVNRNCYSPLQSNGDCELRKAIANYIDHLDRERNRNDYCWPTRMNNFEFVNQGKYSSYMGPGVAFSPGVCGDQTVSLRQAYSGPDVGEHGGYHPPLQPNQHHPRQPFHHGTNFPPPPPPPPGVQQITPLNSQSAPGGDFLGNRPSIAFGRPNLNQQNFSSCHGHSGTAFTDNRGSHLQPASAGNNGGSGRNNNSDKKAKLNLSWDKVVPKQAAKRKCSDCENVNMTLSMDEQQREDASSMENIVKGLTQPLFCKVCSVNLNAPSQAKQHYLGKNHAKKLRMWLKTQEDAGKSNLSKNVGTMVTTISSLSDSDSTNDSTDPGSECSRQSSSSSSSVSLTTAASALTVSSASAPQSTQELNPDIYCKICEVSFNSPKQAEQHYQGKMHGKRLKASHVATNPVTNESAGNVKQGSKFICFVCHIHVTSQDQLDCHLQGAKHLAKLKMQERSQNALQGRWGGAAEKPSGFFKNLLPPGVGKIHMSESQTTSSSSCQFSPPPLKRPRHRDFTNYRTPSGKFYCGACNVTMNNEVQFAQHVDSKKHKANSAAMRSSALEC
ncbi:uncharacterized protein LOC106159638 [Lingula anatina]|uniref:Uncharacterized protein LOC106159638 n=1 Tax=Lingula anatina TaxID=7574 RepID=A0A1S3I241_LINAN|nr:uncharacterized protein LOC106159638 [Lingula anatina]|eukprot:XP_013391414.1 uncharacterized protein LOC106159638 [Lingula anatina]